ncbi:hypothetical protein E4T56_gene1162 [Termitomyces sp. T112]|nr:hypothetical protein E4T56_gene1162 [Termitomyces sp. T112]
MSPDSNNAIKVEVGIEDCLHIEFEYNKSKYHLKDIIVSKIYFLLEKIKHMELSIIRRETTGAASNQYNKSETITKSKFKFLDSAPVRGETIPIHLLLGGFDLTPTFRDVDKKFSTRYYLNLVLNDEENRRYFKKQQIKVIFVKISAEKTLAVQHRCVLFVLFHYLGFLTLAVERPLKGRIPFDITTVVIFFSFSSLGCLGLIPRKFILSRSVKGEYLIGPYD